jgi:TRAP-type mannitol/chloroaromatic compound transport system permease large subunit
MIGMLAILIVLGFFIDQTSIMMITLPFYMPLLRGMGVDLVWFGILYLLCMQIGLLTPPFGLLLFVLKGVAPPGTQISTIYRAAMPYVWLTILMMVFIFLFPSMVTTFVPD